MYTQIKSIPRIAYEYNAIFIMFALSRITRITGASGEMSLVKIMAKQANVARYAVQHTELNYHNTTSVTKLQTLPSAHGTSARIAGGREGG